MPLDPPQLRWFDAEPARLAAEQAAMAAVAPELAWSDTTPGGGWEGLAPVWPFPRPRPGGLDGFLAGRRLRLRVACSQAHPMAAPKLWPLDPEPEIAQRTVHDWHVNGDGSLCLLQTAAAWTGVELSAELVVKAAGWFIEYLLLTDGRIEEMTSAGIATDPCLDGLITEAAGTPHGAERKPSRASSARAPSPPQSGAIHPPNSASDQRDL